MWLVSCRALQAALVYLRSMKNATSGCACFVLLMIVPLAGWGLMDSLRSHDSVHVLLSAGL